MKKRLAAALLAVVAATGLPGCYLSRQIAGDDLVGGPTNPMLWVTVPVDTILSPFEILHFYEQHDSWQPWSADKARAEYVDKFAFDLGD